MATRVSETAAITEPSDIQTALGISGETNYGALMRPDLFSYGDIVNRESKNKPFDRPGLHVINASSRKSGKAEQGIYWGLKIGTVGGAWSGIHSCNCAYVDRPTGDINVSPFRPSDYRGYCRDDKFALTGSSSECEGGSVLYNVTEPINFILDWSAYDTHSTYGVNAYECCDSGNLAAYILCVAVGDYATALINGRQGNTYAAIGAKGASKEFTCPEFPEELKKEATLPVTFFLANPDDLNKEIRGSWQNISSQQVSTSQAIAIPGGHYDAVKIMYTDKSQYGEFTLGTVSQFSGTTLIIDITMQSAPTVDTDYKIVVTFPAAGSGTVTFSVSANQSSLLSRTTFTAPMGQTSGTYEWDAQLYAVTGLGNIPLASSSGTLVYTIE